MFQQNNQPAPLLSAGVDLRIPPQTLAGLVITALLIFLAFFTMKKLLA